MDKAAKVMITFFQKTYFMFLVCIVCVDGVILEPPIYLLQKLFYSYGQVLRGQKVMGLNGQFEIKLTIVIYIQIKNHGLISQ